MTKPETQTSPAPATYGAGDDSSVAGLYESSGYLKAEDIEAGPINLVIASTAVSDAFDKMAVVLTFEDDERKLRLNKTNASTLAKRYGDKHATWVGKKVMLAAIPVTFKGKNVLGIRVI